MESQAGGVCRGPGRELGLWGPSGACGVGLGPSWEVVARRWSRSTLLFLLPASREAQMWTAKCLKPVWGCQQLTGSLRPLGKQTWRAPWVCELWSVEVNPVRRLRAPCPGAGAAGRHRAPVGQAGARAQLIPLFSWLSII